jgi:hypothetical protein
MADPATITTSVFGLGGGNPAEIGSGGSTAYPNKVGFYGTTPVSQRTTTLGTTVATTVAVSTTTGAITSWGFSTSTQANNVVSLLNSVYGALTSLGLIST